MLKNFVSLVLLAAVSYSASAQAPAADVSSDRVHYKQPVSRTGASNQLLKAELQAEMAQRSRVELDTGRESIRQHLREEIKAELRSDVAIQR